MGEVLKSWFRDRLGIMIDLNPDEFGATTKDGTLLAELLHSYGIIDNGQLETIINTEDPALARVNLRHLKLWLKFIGVDCDDDTIEDVSEGKGTTAIRLLYKIFVSLESKDKLHFITQQKEREKYIPNSFKFDVTTVPEKAAIPEPARNPLAEEVAKNWNVVAWHRNDKLEKILERCKLARERCADKGMRNSLGEDEAGTRINESNFHRRLQIMRANEIKELNDFNDRYEKSSEKFCTYSDLCDEREKFNGNLREKCADENAAKDFVESVKERERINLAIKNRKNRMEISLTRKLWEKQICDKEKEFDAQVAGKLFNQSQYEKQMVQKLCEIREQKRRFATNRGTVDRLLREQTEAEHDMELARERENLVKETSDIEAECVRICELHRRIEERKSRDSEEKRFDICSKVLNDIVDIALAAASYRETNDNCIPTRIWNEWKVLFVENERIYFDIEENDDDGEEEEEQIHLRVEKERREEILSESDLDNYLRLESPWAEFAPDVDTSTPEILRLGEIVLGRIVHRLLFLFSRFFSESEPRLPPVAKFSPACILLGVLLDKSVYPVMQSLLNHSRIKILRVEDGVNYCLECYKEEATTTNGREKVEQQEARDNCGIDEQTQTPRSFPKNATSPFSNSARIGKTIDETFAVGKPIPETLNAEIIVEYAKSCFNEFRGWVLLDYPNTFNQMAMLEAALTGSKIPLEAENCSSSSSKKDFDGRSRNGESRLVFNPFGKGNAGNGNFDSYISAFIRAFPKPKGMLVIDEATIDEETMSETLAPDASTMDYFYADRGLAFAFYYSSMDLRTLKKLCRIIIGANYSSPSIEVFGDPRYFHFPLHAEDDETDDDKRLSGAWVVKRLLPAPGNLKEDNSDEGGDSMNEYENGSSDSSAESLIFKLGDCTRDPEPMREDDWNRTRLDSPHQSLGLLVALGNLWKTMEESYVDKLKGLFSSKRFIHAQILPYRNRIAKRMKDLIEMPSDTKQEIVCNFQKSFNAIGEDVRADIDAKCELHCRVADCREQLYRISDQRKIVADLERRRIIREDWTAERIILIVNIYIAMIEAEMHRCVDTVQIVQDYYTSTLKRGATEKRFEKYFLNRLKLRNPSVETSAPISQTNNKMGEGTRGETLSSSRKGVKNLTIKNKHRNREPPAAVDFSVVKKQIEESMIDAEGGNSFDPDSMICCQMIRENILFAENTIETLSIAAFEILRREEAPLVDSTANKGMENSVSSHNRGYCEWKSALEFESNRAITRLKILANAAQSDVEFLFETVRECLDKAVREINDRYNGEVKTVDDIAALFSLAIEEALPVREEVLLDGDRFLLKPSVPEDPSPAAKERIDVVNVRKHFAKEPIEPSGFRIGQLGRLMEIFRFLAPHGSIAERVFIYIIEDIVAFGDRNEGEGSTNLLPNTWYRLITSEGNNVAEIVAEVLCNGEYVDWRDFLIYAMGIAMPSEDEILEASSRFAALDENLTGSVTREQFREIQLWFLNDDSVTTRTTAGDFLRENFQRLDEDDVFYPRDENCSNFLSGSCGDADDSFHEASSLGDSADSNVDFVAHRETARLVPARELLCDMFASGCECVDYRGFLSAFCKDEDPRIGFGKALALLVGKKVCASIDEGELYVEELMGNRETGTIGKDIVTRIIRKDDERGEMLSNTSSFSTNTTNDEVTSSNYDDIKFNKASIDTKNQPKDVEKSLENIFEVKLEEYDKLSKDHSSSETISEYIEITRNCEKQPTTTIISSSSSLSSSDSRIAHWIPIDVCLTVLVASLPWHATRQPDVSETKSCLHECLKKVYTDLFDIELNGDEKSALSHRLINHCFIVNMIGSTTAFTAKNLADILEKYLKRR